MVYRGTGIIMPLDNLRKFLEQSKNTDWWIYWTHEQQVKYKKDHPGSKLKLTNHPKSKLKLEQPHTILPHHDHLEGIEHNISISDLKVFTKKFSKIRFVIDPKGNLHVGDAMKYTHNNIYPVVWTSEREWENKKREECGTIGGYMQYKDGKFSFQPDYYLFSGKKGAISHPLFDKMEKAGIERKKELIDFDEM
jgi:hypothetical protein